MKRIITLSLILLIAGSCLLTADEPGNNIKLSGEIRMRNEFDNRDFIQGTNGYNFNRLRSRFSVDSRINKNLSINFQLQDSRNFGTEDTTTAPGTLKDTKNVDMHLAYANLQNLFFDGLAFKFGRLSLSHGGQRLIGENSWNNVGRAFDGAVVSYITKTFTADLFAATLYESYQPADEADGDKFLTGIWTTYKTFPNHPLDLYLLMDADRQQNNNRDWKMKRYTAGGRYIGKTQQFDLELEFNYQFGKMNYLTDIRAYYFISTLGYSIPHPLKPHISIGFDYLSGDKSNTDRYECFNTLYAARHRYFGYIDFFKDMDKHTKNHGLNDLRLQAKIAPSKAVTIQADYHHFQLSQSTTLGSGLSSDKLGDEFDLRVKYGHSSGVKFEAGFAYFISNDVLKNWKGDDNALWFYGQTTVSF